MVIIAWIRDDRLKFMDPTNKRFPVRIFQNRCYTWYCNKVRIVSFTNTVKVDNYFIPIKHLNNIDFSIKKKIKLVDGHRNCWEFLNVMGTYNKKGKLVSIETRNSITDVFKALNDVLSPDFFEEDQKNFLTNE